MSPVYDLVMDGHYDHYARCGRIARGLLGPLHGATVLDVGGGTGGVAARLVGYGARVVVLDRSAGLVRRARSRPMLAAVADATRLPCPDAAADVVVLCETLHHMAAPGAAEGALREAYRVLRPSGRVLTFEIDPPATLRQRVHLLCERLLFGPVRCWPREWLLDRLERIGFAAACPEHAEVTQGYVVVATKPGPTASGAAVRD